MDSLGLQGYVPASARGTASGSYSGVLAGQPVTIGFKVSVYHLSRPENEVDQPH